MAPVFDVEDGDAAVEVAVRDVRLVGAGVDADLGDAAEALLVAAVSREDRLAFLRLAGLARAGLAVLRQELAVLGELQDVRVARPLPPIHTLSMWSMVMPWFDSGHL